MFTQYDAGSVEVHKRNRLPHWYTEAGIYFITWHLADALPVDAVNALRAEYEYEIERIRRLHGATTHADAARLEAEYRRKIEEMLDRGYGECVLRQPECAQIVADSIVHFEGMRYDLHTWTVVPNHVHVVFRPRSGFIMPNIVGAWKGYTSKEVNKVLGRSGTFWQEEYFDRTIRNAKHLENTVKYVMNNAAAMGLSNWRYSGLYAETIANAL